MGHAAQVEVVGQVIETVLVLEDEPEFPHQFWLLKVFPEVRVKLSHKKRIVSRQRSDEGRVDREVIPGRVTGCAGSTISIEGLFQKDPLTSGDELGLAVRLRRVTARQNGHARQECCDSRFVHEYRSDVGSRPFGCAPQAQTSVEGLAHHTETRKEVQTLLCALGSFRGTELPPDGS